MLAGFAALATLAGLRSKWRGRRPRPTKRKAILAPGSRGFKGAAITPLE
jgi:hypothetical protein